MNFRRTVYRALAAFTIAWIITISFSSLKEKEMFHTKGHLHVIGHVVAFAIVSALLYLSLPTWAPRLCAVILAILLGVCTEGGEHIVFNTPIEFTDILVDCFGTVVGILCANLAKF